MIIIATILADQFAQLIKDFILVAVGYAWVVLGLKL